MTAIASLEFWADPGFTEGCVEVPSTTYVLPDPDFVPEVPSGGWHPAKNALFSRIKLESRFPQLLNMSYMRVVITFNTSVIHAESMTFYGWIDNVTILSDDATGYPVTQVDWHVDYWQTYLADAEFKFGVVKRRQVSGSDLTLRNYPIQDIPFNYKEVYSITEIFDELSFSETSESLVWVIMNVIYKQGTGTTTTSENRVIAIPVILNGFFTYVYNPSGTTDADKICTTTFWYDLLSGRFDEEYGFPPEQILSVYLSPIAPFEYTGNGYDQDGPIVPIDTSWELVIKDMVYPTARSSNCMYVWGGDKRENPFVEHTRNLTSGAFTNELHTYGVTDFNGTLFGTLPWGREFTTVKSHIVNTTSGGYLQMRFNEWRGGVEGMTFNIPLPSLDLSTNSWSTYVYSGQKQYDADMRRYATEHAVINGGISTVSGTIGGLGTGASVGALGGPAGAVIGAVGGALGGLVSGALSTSLSYTENLRYDEMVLEAEATRRADQIETSLIYGDTIDWMWNGSLPVLVEMRPDDYSTSVYLQKLNLMGYVVNEPTESCQALVDAGGPLQIDKLIVGGNIPVQAKRYFRERFRSGVRLIEND